MKTAHEKLQLSTLRPLETGVETPAYGPPPVTALSPWENPTQIERPAFLLSFPLSYSTGVANSLWMQDLPHERRQPDFRLATTQFLELYRQLTEHALIYLLPAPRRAQLQDLVFTANLGVVLEHLPDKNTVIISNFTSEPRHGETEVGAKFFQDMGYEVRIPATKFEGEAELKHLHDHIYVGAYGIRSERDTYEWMERTFDMHIIKVRLTDPYLYHLDCLVFPLTQADTLVCTALLTHDEVAALEQVTNVIDVSIPECYAGICNSVRLPHGVLNASHLSELQAGTEEYWEEVQKNRKLEAIAARLALEVSYSNISQYHKSGAMLSCMVMHLNRHAYTLPPHRTSHPISL
jgi:N-dimethylarginine dimethylaminohydrolase